MRSDTIIWLFNLLYIGTATAFALLRGNMEFMFYVVVLLLIGWGVFTLHKRVGLSRAALWALSFWGLLHMAGGLVPVPESWPIAGDIRVLYSAWIIPGRFKYDHFVHAYGFGVTTWVCWQILRAMLGGNALPSFGKLFFCVAASLGFSALNEIVEFIAVLSIPNTNVGGYMNTGWDLVSNLVGAVIAAILIHCFSKGKDEAAAA